MRKLIESGRITACSTIKTSYWQHRSMSLQSKLAKKGGKGPKNKQKVNQSQLLLNFRPQQKKRLSKTLTKMKTVSFEINLNASEQESFESDENVTQANHSQPLLQLLPYEAKYKQHQQSKQNDVFSVMLPSVHLPFEDDYIVQKKKKFKLFQSVQWQKRQTIPKQQKPLPCKKYSEENIEISKIRSLVSIFNKDDKPKEEEKCIKKIKFY